MLTILIKAYCVNVVVDIKPIYLNKRYLFQNKICYLDRIYFLFAKITISKLTLYKLKLVIRLVKKYRLYATEHKNVACCRLIY